MKFVIWAILLALVVVSCSPQGEINTPWTSLFDGETLAGWHATGDVDWAVSEGAIRATRGEVALLSSDDLFGDFELELDFWATAETNSGVFLRTPRNCLDPSDECYEVNIAPLSNPFPTGSLVAHQRVARPELSDRQWYSTWHSLRLRIEGAELLAWVDDELWLSFVAGEPLAAGYLGLQHNTGEVRFRDVRVRPLEP